MCVNKLLVFTNSLVSNRLLQGQIKNRSALFLFISHSFYLSSYLTNYIFYYQIMSSLNPNGEHNLAHIYFYLLLGREFHRGESGHAGKEGGLGAGSQCSINQKEWHSCRPWQPSCHPHVCSPPPPPSHSTRTTLVMGRVERREWESEGGGGERTLLIKHLRLIVMKCHP